MRTRCRSAEAAGRPPSRRWSTARRLLDAAEATTLSGTVRATAEAWFGPIGHYEALATIGRTLRPRVYLEIGVDRGGSLAVAHADARRIAVDPAPRLDRIAHAELARPGRALLATTSDEFFERI